MPIAAEVVKMQSSRVLDGFGSGQYHSSRDGGKRRHAGLDIIVPPGEAVFSPISGNIVRQAFPYKDTKDFAGVVVKGDGDWNGYEIKLFYVEGLFSGSITQGSVIGTSQDLTKRYPGIINHVHVEVRFKDEMVDPREIWGQCF